MSNKRRLSQGSSVMGLPVEDDDFDLDDITPSDNTDRRKSTSSTTSRGSRRASFGNALSSARNSKNSQQEQTRIADMYKMVIKLSSENKINAKNSWNLDLIDHMGQLIKEDSKNKDVNFQKASCTLDASIKIYSHRVDDTWSSSFRILENLSRNGGGDSGDGEDDEVEDDGASGGSGGGATTRRAAKVGSRSASARLGLINTIEKNAKSLNMARVDGESVTDPMFQKMSKAFDEGGAKGMLMNNLRLSPDSCSLVFSSNDVTTAGDKITRKAGSEANVGVSGELLCDLLNRLNIAPTALSAAPLCPILSEYRTTIGIDLTAASSSSAYSTLPAPTLAVLPEATDTFGASVQAPRTQSVGGCFDDSSTPAVADFGGYDDGCDDNDDYCPMPDDASAADDAEADNAAAVGKWASLFGNPAAAETGTKTLPGPSTAPGGVEWDGLGVSNADEYCFFNMDGLLATAGSNKWAGAKHWKFAAQKRRNTGVLDQAQKASGTTTVAKAKGKQPSSLFDFADGELLDVKLFAPPAAPKRKVKGAAASSNLYTDAALKKQQTESAALLLPGDSKIELHDLCRLFLRPNMIAPPVAVLSLLKPKTGGGKALNTSSGRYGGSSNGVTDLIWGVCMPSSTNPHAETGVIDTAAVDEAANDVGSGQYMTESGDVIYDNDFAGGDDGDDNDYDSPVGLGGDVGDDNVDDIVRDLTASLATGLAINTDNLLQAKRTVGKINVGYATSAKLVNVKKLKTDLWGCIESGGVTSEGKNAAGNVEKGKENVSNANADDNGASMGLAKGGDSVLSFQNVVRQVATAPASCQKDASLSFYFISLLHLANEKCLAITGNEGMNDLSIANGKPAEGARVLR